MLLKHSPPSIKERYIEEISQLLCEGEYNLMCSLPIDLSNSGIEGDNSLSLIQVVCGYMLLIKAGLLKQVISFEVGYSLLFIKTTGAILIIG